MRLAPPPLALVAPARQAADGRRQRPAARRVVVRLPAVPRPVAPRAGRVHLTAARRCARRLRRAPLRRRARCGRAAAARAGAGPRPGLPGVAAVYPVATYHADTDTVPALVGAIPLWGAERSTAGQGVKVGIIDDGIDAGAPFLCRTERPPPGFPRGQERFTSGRVIVARSFAGKTHRTPTTSPSIRTSRSTGRTSPASSPARTEPSRGPGSGCLSSGPVRCGARRLARQLPRARPRRSRDGRHRLDDRARRRGRQGGRGRHGRAQPLAGRPQIDPRPMPCRWRWPMPRAPASPRSSRRATASTRGATVHLVPRHQRHGDHRRGHVDPPRLRGQRPVSGEGSPELTPFSAVPSLAPRVTTALGRPTPLVGPAAYRLDRRACRERRAPAAACRRRRPARRLQLRLQGDQRPRGGGDA